MKKVLETSPSDSEAAEAQHSCERQKVRWKSLKLVAKPTLTLPGKSMCLFICGQSLKQAVKVCLKQQLDQ